jgi:hypothetical protein
MRTSLFTVNDIGDPEPVIATVACNRIIIGEDASVSGWPLSEYEVKGNYVGSVFIRKSAGLSYQFESTEDKTKKSFLPGQIVGYVKTVSGSTTFYKVEE